MTQDKRSDEVAGDAFPPGWSIPLQGGVPAGAQSVPLADFIAVIRAVEDKFPVAEQVNTRLMITRLRKLFYGTPGWDEHLIPGAKPVPPVYPVREVETGRRDWAVDGAPDALEYVDSRAELDVDAPAGSAEARLKDPASVQQVLLPGGDFADLGHVLAGLDALNYPGAVTAPAGTFALSSNADAVTWLGDLGSVLAEAVFQRARLGRALTAAELQAQVDQMAPVQDMLGNVDAYAIGTAAASAISSTAGKKVSGLLLGYYGPSGAARSLRFTVFAAQIGLGTLQAGSFTGEAEWLARYETETGNAAALYVGAGAHVKGYVNPVGWLELASSVKTVTDDPLRRALLEEFLRQLKGKVAAEAAAGH